jgi:hypothetical protein
LTFKYYTWVSGLLRRSSATCLHRLRIPCKRPKFHHSLERVRNHLVAVNKFDCHIKSTTDELGLKLSQATHRTNFSRFTCRPHFPGLRSAVGKLFQLMTISRKGREFPHSVALVIVGPTRIVVDNVAVSLLEEISGLLNAHFQVYNHDSSS